MATKWVGVKGAPGIRRWGKTNKIQVRISTGARGPNGRYGSVERTVTGTLTQAKRAMRDLQAEVDAGDATPPAGELFGATLDDWPTRRQVEISPTTYARYRTVRS